MDRHLPSLSALRAFEAAARHESFKRAYYLVYPRAALADAGCRRLRDWLRAEAAAG